MNKKDVTVISIFVLCTIVLLLFFTIPQSTVATIVLLVVALAIVMSLIVSRSIDKTKKYIITDIGLDTSIDYFKNIHYVVKAQSRQTYNKYCGNGLLSNAYDIIAAIDAQACTIRKYFDNPNSANQYFGGTYVQSKLLHWCDMLSDKYRIKVTYTTPSGRSTSTCIVHISADDAAQIRTNPKYYMSKSEYSQYIKRQDQALLDKIRSKLYNRINAVIDKANETKQALIQKSKAKMLDDAVSELYKNAVSNLQKLKSANTAAVDIINKAITACEHEVQTIAEENDKLLKYYRSKDFLSIRTACNTLMQSQLEFNQYIEEKSNSLASLLGGTVLREETVHDDNKNYIRPYVKDVTPFTAEVSAAVFASAENDPMKYIVKHFYADKARLPQQLQKLYTLVEELDTLNEARAIIEKKKQECAQYLNNVPAYVMNQDSAGFYARLGFANIDEKILNLEYKFQYTSDGGYAQKSFVVKITEELIIQLIGILENKLTYEAFAKEQRAMMTSKLREEIKERDNHTCCKCGNSTYNEPNLLLEIDHILPVSKGGLTKPDNLQTLCWRCNRSKGNKT